MIFDVFLDIFDFLFQIRDTIGKDPGQRGAYRGRKRSLSPEQITDVRRRIAAGEGEAHVARELGVSREAISQCLRASA